MFQKNTVLIYYHDNYLKTRRKINCLQIFNIFDNLIEKNTFRYIKIFIKMDFTNIDFYFHV